MRYFIVGFVFTTAALAKISTDATCGGSKGQTCLGSKWGDCCSQYRWCGSTNSYCGTGCQGKFGTCKNGVQSSSVRSTVLTPTSSNIPSASPSSSLKRTTNARYGGTTEFTYLGSKWGDCCSKHGWCGSTDDYCGAGCQSPFGYCKPSRPSPSATPSSKVSSSFSTFSIMPSSRVSSSSFTILSSSTQDSSSMLPSSSSSSSQVITSSFSSSVSSSVSIVTSIFDSSSTIISVSMSSLEPSSSAVSTPTPTPTPTPTSTPTPTPPACLPASAPLTSCDENTVYLCCNLCCAAFGAPRCSTAEEAG